VIIAVVEIQRSLHENIAAATTAYASESGALASIHFAQELELTTFDELDEWDGFEHLQERS
jgi:hypothetical protein